MQQRKKKLIEPRLQLRFSLAFLSTALLLVLVQAIVIHFVLQRLAARLPHDSELLRAEIPGTLLISFAFTFLFLAPLSLAIGVNATFRVLGPLYRFRVFLRQLADGEHPAPCRIRERDELQDFCDLLNEVTEPLRRSSPEVEVVDGPEQDPELPDPALPRESSSSTQSRA
jgi:hypothetical protein